MRTNRLIPLRYPACIAPLCAGACLSAAPLTWFPGPSFDTPTSGAATTVISGGNNLLIGGDSFYGDYSGYYAESFPQYLEATNAYWTYLPTMYSSAPIAAGVAGSGD